ncbi:uncharacterized protein LOC115876286 [Sitophilus oryzae]|uniref:Uncharacterized protein LOC115876286 n=1 Tax=Sitophilus oryzae TaxID=7048 RepID=A0A6J2XA80_SITOR|nr:uncharacterized protein LOC115876286 [Sitophilus oryzae]
MIGALLTIVALATTALSATVPLKTTEKKPTESSVETFDSYSVKTLPSQLPLTIQLPNQEPPLPFYPSEPSTYLKAPEYFPNTPTDFYQIPIPSDILTAPLESSIWNPENDPTLYYELPSSITKEDLPTGLYPKKFNQDIHFKNKPLSTIPKKEIILEPINQKQYNLKQKELYKAVDKLSKKENQKKLEESKAKQAIQI